jgi:hypothetical protein
MSRTTVRAALAALAIAAVAAAPLVAFAEVTNAAKTTVSADPNDIDWYYIPDGGGGGGGGG